MGTSRTAHDYPLLPHQLAHHYFPRKRHIIGLLLALILIVLLAARIYLNIWLLDYVNKVLGGIDGYQASVHSIDIELYRGAYRIHDLKVYKKTGNIPTPFIDIAQIDLSIQWGALFHGRIVSDVDLDRPILNFATSPSGNTTQTGREANWNAIIRDLMPIDINLVTFRDGKLSYQDFSTTPKVNVYINHMSGELRNLRNVEDKSQTLPSPILVEGESLGGGKLLVKGRLNVMRPIPDMDLDLKLENADLTAFSDYTNAYAAIDIKHGKLSVYSEFGIKNNRISGYVKPIATDVSLIDLRKASNPIKLVWETFAAIVVSIFTNHTYDQFATKVPLEGNLDDIQTDTWATISGIVRNAFVAAFKKGIDSDIHLNRETEDGKNNGKNN